MLRLAALSAILLVAIFFSSYTPHAAHDARSNRVRRFFETFDARRPVSSLVKKARAVERSQLASRINAATIIGSALKRKALDALDNGFLFVVHDCNLPTFYYPQWSSSGATRFNYTTMLLAEHKQDQVHASAECSWTEDVWRAPTRSASDRFYISYNSVRDELSRAPSASILRLMRMLGLCHDFMRFLMHPHYTASIYPPPVECNA